MTRPDFDVVVAGGGAGGAAAAYHLTQAGLRTLVVEKARLPRYKVCGGAIPRIALQAFPLDLQSVVEAAPEEALFTFPGLPPARVGLDSRPVCMVMRDRFDAYLLARSGAEVLEGTALTGLAEEEDRVRVWLGDRELTARYLVGADGAASLVARVLGLRRRRRLGGTLEAEVPLAGRPELAARYGHTAVFALGAIPWGYAWVFPKGECLTAGIARMRPGRVNLRAGLERVTRRLGISLEGVPLRGHPLPGYQIAPWPLWGRAAWRTWGDGPQEKLSTRRCVLVGDAAGLVDPFIGEGIRYALGSGRLAAAAIAADDLRPYDQAVWREMGHHLATGAEVARVYYMLPLLSYIFGVCNPATLRWAVALVSGRGSYIGSGRRIIANALLWPYHAWRAENPGRSEP